MIMRWSIQIMVSFLFLFGFVWLGLCFHHFFDCAIVSCLLDFFLGAFLGVGLRWLSRDFDNVRFGRRPVVLLLGSFLLLFAGFRLHFLGNFHNFRLFFLLILGLILQTLLFLVFAVLALYFLGRRNLDDFDWFLILGSFATLLFLFLPSIRPIALVILHNTCCFLGFLFLFD